MSKDRVSRVDTDIEHVRRPDIIKYLKDKYGLDQVSQIITFGTLAARMAIKDIGKVMGFSPAFCGALAKLVPAEVKMTINKALDVNPEFKHRYETEDNVRMIVDMAKKLEGNKRHASQHACFDAKTMITTKTGLRPICEVQVGDEVLTHLGRFKPVVRTMVTHTDVVYKLNTTNASVQVTGNHPMLVMENADTEPEWKAVEQIHAGEFIVMPMSGKTYKMAEVLSITSDNVSQDMYNLTVLDDSSYTANGLAAHNCGTVISPSKISDFMPTAMIKNDETGEVGITTQVVMTEVEELSLLKMDLLGLKNLSVIHDCMNGIEKKTGKKMDYHEIPMDDREVFKFLRDGNTGGVFQLESPGMTKVVQQMLVDADSLPEEDRGQFFERMIACVALYRPGPMDYIPDYTEGMRNPKAVHYDCEEERSILASTYGVLVYQGATRS